MPSARSSWTGCPTGGPGAWSGSCKREVGDSLDLLLGELVALGVCQPDRTFITSLDDLGERLAEMTVTGEPVGVNGLATRVQRPAGWGNQKVLYDAKRHPHTAQGIAVSTLHGDLLWADGGWPGSCHEHELLQGSGSPRSWTPPASPPWSTAGSGAWPRPASPGAPVGDRRTRDRRTRDRLSDAQRDHNRLQAGLRALVEQSISHLGNAWALRRCRGRLPRGRDVSRAA